MNAMKKLIAYYGDSPVYVEGFSADCARSCDGSVHVLPRKPVTVTDDEYEHIKAKYSYMMPKLKVIAEIGKEGSGKPEPSAPKDAAEEKGKPSGNGGKSKKKKKAAKKKVAKKKKKRT